ncbi:MAG TPA: ChrR family anti-sigma-E factor [Terriglobales bacterium]|nr:ChrR family anti-sigma-E factor [Terriglobales bacterium]
MTARHHPSVETLLHYAAGTLAGGLRLVVSVHLATCPVCRAQLAKLEAIGGIMLDETAPAQMEPDAFARVMARIDAAPVAQAVTAPHIARHLTEKLIAPAALQHRNIGPWRWLGPGRRWSRVRLDEDPETLVVLLRVAGGRRLPKHGHQGIELTHVLYGSFSDETGRYVTGDLYETDDDIHHRPVADPGSECVCLVALEASIRLEEGLGRLLQRIIGF